ncbi:hypothetical protein J2045_001943 [Peteryoungia aggregata LMG 23059]|uniref:Uncharacterized protein n=1 Tax=Peteryoungia aggregata LMG 23059 TaxID=1368425 RepID=A0ABU0G6E4_9HYPH|nr:hypothetical protein [Peteryoungia aggregata]MDQ0420916.1 hypothetical protein [Peteryoungia aggregata LMG 23059]
MVDIKNRFGHILKERGLVMRGQAGDDSLTLEFRSEYGNRKLPIRLDIDGPSDTGAEVATWEHASLSAQIHEDVTLGDTGYYCHLYREDHNVDSMEFDTEEEFAAEVGAHIQECVIVNFAKDDFAVNDAIALTYLALADIFEPGAPPFSIERRGKTELLTITDLAGKVLTFASTSCELEISVNGKVVSKLCEPAQWKVEEVIADHFTTAQNFKHR